MRLRHCSSANAPEATLLRQCSSDNARACIAETDVNDSAYVDAAPIRIPATEAPEERSWKVDTNCYQRHTGLLERFNEELPSNPGLLFFTLLQSRAMEQYECLMSLLLALL